MPQATVEETTLVVDGVNVFCRRVEGDGTPTVYVHGNPTHSEDWLGFMRGGGPSVAVDLPGWGRSDRPDPATFDYTMEGLAAFHERCLERLGISTHKLVAHDWGALALISSQRRPQQVERLVLINAVPLLPGYRWHWVARLWRRRGVGEILNATQTRPAMALTLRQARGDRSAMPPEFVDMIYEHWDRGTSKAVLTLYRGADPDRLAKAGEGLSRLECPALVLWGERDPYLPFRFGRFYAERLPNAEYEGSADAGHWPWLDRPDLVERVLTFLDRSPNSDEGSR